MRQLRGSDNEGDQRHARAPAEPLDSAAEREEVELALRESLRELRSKDEELCDLIENAPIGLHRLAADGTILWANRAELEVLGYSKAEYVGRHIAEFHVEESVIANILERLARGEPVKEVDARLRAKDGSIRHVLVHASVYTRDGQFVHVRGFTRDITERKKATARAERLGRITAAIADAVSNEQVYEALVESIHETLDAHSTALWLVDDDGRSARLARQRGYSEEAARRYSVLPLEAIRRTPALDCVRQGEPIWIASQAELISRYPHLRESVTRSSDYRVSCLPLIVHGRVLGSLGLTIKATPHATDEERDFLLLAARYASQAVERLRLFDLERKSRAAAHEAAIRMGVLSHASQVFVEADLGLEERLRGIVVKLGTVLESAVGITLLEPDGTLRTCAVHHPVPAAERLLRELSAANPGRLGEGVAGQVAATGATVLIPAEDPKLVAERAASAFRPFLEEYPVHGLICAALRSRGRTIGTVMLSRAEPGPPYTRADVALLEELAARAAGAIENSRLYEESCSARRRAEQLYHFAQTVAVADNIKVVFEAALGAIGGALETHRAAILTLDNGRVMRFAAYRNLTPEYRAAVEGHSPWPPDAIAPEPVLVPDAQNDPAFSAFTELFRKEGIGALAFVPLVTRERLIGKFMIYYEKPHVFAKHEVEMALAISNHLASVVTRFAAVAELKETLRANELFAGALAHDLRNPLSAMMTAAQLVLMMREGENATDPTAKPLSKILSSGQRIAGMIEQLLDFTRARSGGGIEIQPREVDSGELLSQACDELELVHPDWMLRVDRLGDLGVVWDSERMLQVISNLIANAGQHGRKGCPIAVVLDGAGADEIKLDVHNDGAIPAALLPNIFDPFRTSRSGGARSHGLGLGLFIVREVVRAHGGTVKVASSEESGTTFSVLMPRKALAREGRPQLGR